MEWETFRGLWFEVWYVISKQLSICRFLNVLVFSFKCVQVLQISTKFQKVCACKTLMMGFAKIDPHTRPVFDHLSFISFFFSYWPIKTRTVHVRWTGITNQQAEMINSDICVFFK